MQRGLLQSLFFLLPARLRTTHRHKQIAKIVPAILARKIHTLLAQAILLFIVTTIATIKNMATNVTE